MQLDFLGKKLLLLVLAAFMVPASLSAQKTVSQEEMQKVYDEVKTHYKYGLVMTARERIR